MKKKGNCAFTLVELIAVVAILSILLCIAVPNMMNYINAAHEATAQTEARICVDAVQRYLNDEKEKGKLTGGMLLRLIGLDLSNSDGPLKDYIIYPVGRREPESSLWRRIWPQAACRS